MKIFIDTVYKVIYEFENKKIGKELIRGYNIPINFQRIVDDILTPSQLINNTIGNDISYNLSKKKETILKSYIKLFNNHK